MARGRSVIVYIIIGILLVLLGLAIPTLVRVAQLPTTPSVSRCCTTQACIDRYGDTGDCYVDVVVVGCGSAGSVISSLLSQNFSVLCLEKGKYYQDQPQIKYILQDTTFWMFVPVTMASIGVKTLSDPDPNINNFPANVQIGSTVGGSGNVDYSLIVYPSPNLTKSWAAIGGAQWNYNNVLSYIQSYERFLGTPSACPHGGAAGQITNLPVTSAPPGSVAYDLMQAIITASPADNGVTPIVSDQNCGLETSFSNQPQYFWNPINSSLIERSSPGLTFLGPSVLSPSGFGIGARLLRVLPETVVDKFYVDPSTRRATYVEASVRGQTRRFYANKQIVISGNGIYSPGILERSGVGDPVRLSALGIPVVQSLPQVGENFQTHMGTSIVFITNQTVDSYDFLSTQGLLSILPAFNGSRSMQLLVVPGFGFNIYNGQAAPPFPVPVGFRPVSMILSTIAPRSRGSVHINSREPSRWPDIQTNAYSDTGDIDFQLVNQTMTSVYQAVLALRVANPQYRYEFTTPLETVFENATMLAEYIKLFPLNQDHWSSTCSMGPVLDGNLALRGVQGVTVADTSSLPTINNGNTRTQALITGTFAAQHLLATL